MTTNYRRGYAFELRVRAALEADGYWARCPRGSHGKADVVAAKKGQLLFVQCKRGRPVLPPSERVGLLADCAQAGAVPLVAYMPGVRGIAYRRLTGPGPKDFVAWSPDELGAAS